MFGTSKKYFNCIDLHCGGEPARILISGCPPIPGSTMAEKRKELIDNYDYIRQLLLQEPRGYPCQNLNLIFPSLHPEADFGYVIAEQNCIYPLFSGHNTICVVTALLVSHPVEIFFYMSCDSPFFKESGMIGMCEPMTHFNLESPGGLVKVVAECQGGQVKSVNLESMPSFVGYTNKKVNYSFHSVGNSLKSLILQYDLRCYLNFMTKINEESNVDFWRENSNNVK